MTQTFDGLQNIVAQLGARGDKSSYDTYGTPIADQMEIDNAYRASGWFRKIVDILPDDETREGRSWKADQKQIQAIELEQKRLGLMPKIQEARKLARKDGWSLMLLGAPGNPASELRPEAVAKGGLRFVTVLNRSEIALSEMETNPLSPWYGLPVRGQVIAGTYLVDVHPSRLVLFIGNRPRTFARMSGIWGDSLWLSLQRDIKNSDLAPSVVASLLHEAKRDIWRIPDFMSQVSTAEYEQTIMKRFALVQTLASMVNTTVADKDDEFESRQITWAGLPDIITKFLEILAGVSGIPATRLLGKSPDGMNATGESDLQMYADTIRARQTMDIEPAIATLDECLIRSALGTRPPELWYAWNPIYRPSAKVQADTEKVRAETFKIDVDTGAFDQDMLAEVRLNSMVESGLYPGLEQAMAERPDMGVTDPDEQEAKEIARLTTEAEIAASSAAQEPAVTADAAPRTLYVRRDVLNWVEISKWAKAQGFTDLVDDPHVTIVSSAAPIDWMTMGESWNSEIKLAAGGPRLVETLGNFHVLLFTAYDIVSRHEQAERAGATWDFPEFQPHISLQKGGDMPANVVPYRGKIVLGPEIFEERKLD